MQCFLQCWVVGLVVLQFYVQYWYLCVGGVDVDQCCVCYVGYGVEYWFDLFGVQWFVCGFYVLGFVFVELQVVLCVEVVYIVYVVDDVCVVVVQCFVDFCCCCGLWVVEVVVGGGWFGYGDFFYFIYCQYVCL